MSKKVIQTIQIDGTFSFIDNIRNCRIGDYIKLIPNSNNRISKDAIGAYTITQKKIGYIPYKNTQVDINAKYKIEKINLTQQNPILLISREHEKINIIRVGEKHKELNNKLITNDFMHFIKYLRHAGHTIIDGGIIYNDENYIDIFIESSEIKYYYTVTKKYYDKNIFLYDEFFDLGLIKRNTYKPFFVHRPEIYIELSYISINKLMNKKAIKALKYDITFVENNEIDIKDFMNNGLCYNHELKCYCMVDLYDGNNIVEIVEDLSVINSAYLLLKLIISDKTRIYISNSNKILRYSASNDELEMLKSLL